MKHLLSPLPLALIAVSSAQYAYSESKLEEVTITSSKIEMPLRQVGASISVVNAQEIKLRGYNSVQELLRTQVSIAATNSGGAGKATALRIRGEEGYRTLVMIDGVEVSDPTGTQVGPQIQHLSTASDIERIEVLRGPQGFIYGADAGGVINIFTKESEKPFEAHASLEAGKYGSHAWDAFAAGSGSQINYFISANKQKTDGFNARSSDMTEDNDGYENTTVHAKLGFEFTDSLALKVVGRTIDADTQFDSCGYFNESFDYISTNECEGDFKQDILKATLSFENEITKQEIAFAKTDMERENFAEGNTSFQIEGDIKKAEYLGSYKVLPTITLVSGADLKQETLDNSITENERDQLGIFSELQAQFSDVFLSIGARYDDNDDFGEHLSARASAAYVIPLGDNELKFRSSIGNGFRAPSLSEIAYNNSPSAFGDAAATVLEEEQSRGIDFGVEFYTLDGASYKLGLFKQEIDNEIFFDLVEFSGYLQESTGSESEGLELELEKPVFEHMTIIANLTYNKTETSDDQQRIRRPELLANIALETRWLKDKLSTMVNLRAARDSENQVFGVGRVPLDDYEVLDLSARYAIDEAASIFFRVQNLLDEGYEENGGYNTANRAATIGAELNF